MAITENKNKVSSLAKDFGMQSKDIIAILKDYTEAPKGHSQVLSDRELSIVFDYLQLLRLLTQLFGQRPGGVGPLE